MIPANIYFFLMKVGTGNNELYPSTSKTFLEKVTYEDSIREGDVLELYTGHGTDTWRPQLKGREFLLLNFKDASLSRDFPIKKKKEKNQKWVDDLFWMSFVTSEEFSDQSRIMVFGKKYLFFFQALEEKWQPNKLEVKVIKVIPRNKLPPSIDSLSVFQFLNQGSMRPLFSCGASRENEFKDLDKSELKKFKISWDKSSHYSLAEADVEYKYGSKVREVLEALISDREYDAAKENLPILLSPAQLEAAASYFAMDLGYLPDFYAAGSFAIYDVRARKTSCPIFRKEELNIGLQSVIDQRFSKNYISNHDVLQIQCKDYDDDGGKTSTIVSENDIHFIPTGVNPVGNKISLQWILEQMKEIRNLQNEHQPYFFLELWWQKQLETFKKPS